MMELTQILLIVTMLYLINCNCSKRNKPIGRSIIAKQLLALLYVPLRLRYVASVVISPRKLLRKIINYKKNHPLHYITLLLLNRCTSLISFETPSGCCAVSQICCVLASLSQAHPLRSSHSMLRFACTAYYASLRKLSRPCSLIHFVLNDAPFSFGSTHIEACSTLSTRHYSAALPLRALKLLRDVSSLGLSLRSSTGRSRLSASASLRSLVLRASLAYQPSGFALLPCCCRISSQIFQRVSRGTMFFYTVNTALHSLIRSNILSSLQCLSYQRVTNNGTESG